MYRKLLKYEWKATWPVLLIVAAVCIGASLLGGLGLRTFLYLLNSESEEPLWIGLNFMTVFVSILTIALCNSGFLFFLIWRFYKSRFTDEGYITFTLPATTHQILLSSFTNTILSMAIMVLVVIICSAIMILIGHTGLPDLYGFDMEYIFQSAQEFFLDVGTGWFLVLVVVYSIVAILSNITIMMLCITMGSVVVRKYKLLASIGIYYGCNLVLSIISTVISFVATGASMSSETAVISEIHLTYGIMTGVYTVITLGCYFLMHRLISKKLNLP